MTAVALGLTPGGGNPDVEATAAGIRSAFLVGAIISVFAIPAAFFIRRDSGSAVLVDAKQPAP